MNIFDALVQNTDISFITDSVDDILMALLAKEMGTEHANHFKQQFQLFLHYGRDDKAYVIDFDCVWPWIGFTKKGNATRVLFANFDLNSDYIQLSNLVPQAVLSNDNWGNMGDQKITILLNFSTFMQFCLVAATSKAKHNRIYAGKIQRVMNLYLESKIERSALNELTVSQELANLSRSATYEIERTRHRALVEANRHVALFYAIRVQTSPDGSFVVKYGYTKDDINQRCTDHSRDFGCEALVLDVYPCFNCECFETDMFDSAKFISLKFRERINNKKSNETFLFKDRETYDELARFIKATVKKTKYHCTPGESVTVTRLGNQTIELTNRKLELQNHTKLIEYIIRKDDNAFSLGIMGLMYNLPNLPTQRAQQHVVIENELEQEIMIGTQQEFTRDTAIQQEATHDTELQHEVTRDTAIQQNVAECSSLEKYMRLIASNRQPDIRFAPDKHIELTKFKKMFRIFDPLTKFEINDAVLRSFGCNVLFKRLCKACGNPLKCKKGICQHCEVNYSSNVGAEKRYIKGMENIRS